MRPFFCSSFLLGLLVLCHFSFGKDLVSIHKAAKEILGGPDGPRTVPTSDSLALVALYNSTNGANWKIKTNWLSGKVNTWHGVTVEGGRITNLYLGGNQLHGSIPTELGALTSLKTLDLSYNQLSDTIPASLANLAALQELKLAGNRLSGNIPAELGKLATLQYLNLYDNRLTNLPPFIASLKSCYVSRNQLTFESLEANMSRFKETTDYTPQDSVGASADKLITVGQSVELSVQVDGANNLYQWTNYGADINGATNPTLTVSAEGLYGCKITNTVVTGLTLHRRQVHIVSLGYRTVLESDSLALVDLYNSTNGANWISNTNWLTGKANTWYGVMATNGRVRTLDLSFNNLVGSIPTSLGNLSDLRILSLSANALTGSIPASLGKLTNLTDLSLSVNRLSGSIPTELANLKYLKIFKLDFNQLTGSLPTDLSTLIKLEYLGFSNNQITGSLPIGLGNLRDLQHINAGNNQLIGSLPLGWENLKQLHFLHLEKNQLGGDIPEGVGLLTTLQELHLNDNQFTSLPKQKSDFTSLGDLYIFNNRLTFESLEANIGNLARIFYTPQDSVLANASIDLIPDQPLTLSALVGGANNRYQWTLDGSDISGATNATLQVFAEGVYSCKISNTLITDLTLYRRKIRVSIPSRYKKSQTITFAALFDKTYGDPTFTIAATASSGLAVTYISSNTSVATIAGNTVTIVGAGTTILTAMQAGNSSYNAATPVNQTLLVNKTAQTIAFEALPNKNINDVPFSLAATASSGLPVSFRLISGPATLSGTVLTLTGTGLIKVQASQDGDENYQAATAVERSFTVQVILATQQFISDEVKVFPNPTVGIVKVTLPASMGMVELEVWNAQGKVVLEKNLNEQESELNLVSLPAGLYLVQIKAQSKQFYQRILKQ